MPTLSVIIPALNEEANIAAAVQEAIVALGDRFSDYELLLFDDGSTDQTGAIMDKLAAENPRIRVTHNSTSRNIGGAYKQGIALARHEYILMVPGDNENPSRALQPALDCIGKADMVVPYTTNTEVRSLTRRIGSRGYTVLINTLFGRRMKYYNGTCVIKTADLRSIEIKTSSFAYQTEALLKLLKMGKTFVDVGIEIQPPAETKSKALRLKNLLNVLQAIMDLVVEIHFSPSSPSLAAPRQAESDGRAL